MTLYKVFKYLALLIGLIGLFFLGRVLFAGDDAITDSGSLQESVLTPFLYLSYLILIITLGSVVVFMFKDLFTGNVKNTLMSIGAFIVIIVLAYVFTTGAPYTMKDGELLPASTVHWVSTGLVTFYILAGVAVLAMLFTGITKLMR